jgi:hypothetical protein
MPEGIGGMLADRYCRGGSFILCPIYQRFERSIDAAHRDLRAMARRDNGSMGAFARGEHKHRKACI